jgi:outer membrane protein assembly factor BamD (BamD/ComL family)
MKKKQSWRGKHLCLFFACIIITSILICGCSHLYDGFLARPAFKEANEFLSQGNYNASLSKYEQIIVRYPTAGDRVLFEMGVIYAYPRNQQKDYQKSLESFQRLIKDYPGSEYRQDSEVMIALMKEVTSKDDSIITQQKQIQTLEQQVKELEKKIEQIKEVDMNLKEKKKSLPEEK